MNKSDWISFLDLWKWNWIANRKYGWHPFGHVAIAHQPFTTLEQ